MSNFLSNKTLLLPFDFSDAATSAFDEAISLADSSTRIHVLNVLVPVLVISAEPGMTVELGNDSDRIANAISSMKEVITEPGEGIEFVARVGDFGLEIVDYAKEIGADLIMMPSHGRTGIKRMLLGSVAERVVRHAECPVMILRKKKSK